MTERLVDVVNENGNPVHTYPITLSTTASEAAFEAKALEAAQYGRLVPTAELAGLTTRMHVSQGGALEPYGDGVPSTSQTKASLDQEVRAEAYRKWVLSGQPDDRSNEFWNEAREEQCRARAYILWQQEGSPNGRSDEFWYRTTQFDQS
ncbi:DUF2934 domain-containing protein [Acidipila sp. EB88]|nr:DUF2934 domain-containing protein [Acidipila sp. EB88]